MTVKCPRCEGQYPDGANYCRKCGVRLIRSPLSYAGQAEAETPGNLSHRLETQRLNQETNTNGELKQLLELRRRYRTGVAALEAELKGYALALETELNKYKEEIAHRKKRFKEKYIEDLSNFVFAEPSEKPTSVATEGSTAKSHPGACCCLSYIGSGGNFAQVMTRRFFFLRIR